MEFKRIIMLDNDCFKVGNTMTPKGIIIHSTGVNNPNLSRYIQPDDNIIGKNKYNNHWNRKGVKKCVHAFIGLDKNKTVRVYQTLPFNMKCWGCGSGRKGSYNKSYIQIEMCEDGLDNKEYFDDVIAKAIGLCKYLCDEYNIPIKNVISHKEAYKQGYASNHGDCDNWLKKFNLNMDWVRSQISSKKDIKLPFKVKVKVDVLNIRLMPSIKEDIVGRVKKGGVYTIVEVKDGWGKLKSGAGWINISNLYVEKRE